MPPPTSNALEWASHPARERPRRAMVAVTAVILAGVFAGYAMDSAGFGLLATVIMFLSLAKFFFRTRYKLDDTGVTVKTTTLSFTRPWSQFRSYYIDRNGVLLSPFGRPSRLENFRGLYLNFSENREAVVERVKTHVRTPVADEVVV